MNISRRFISMLLLIIVTVCPLPAIAQEDAFDSLEAGLEQFLDMKIITATQKEQKASEAPAIISVLTGDQIRDLGVTSLSQALSFLPGIIVSESYFGYTMVSMRGILQTHYNNKVLLLVNGHPMREVVNGSYHLEIVPIDVIARIEVIRGPGSALYGTNAFAGIINIITLKGSDLHGPGGSIGGGSYATFENAFTFGENWSDNDLVFSLSIRDDTGYPIDIEADEQGQAGTLDMENDVTSVYGSYSYQDVTFSCAYFQQKKNKFGITPVLAYTGLSEFEGGFADVRWSKKLDNSMTFQMNVRYDLLERDFELGHFPYDGFDGHENADTVMESGGQLFGSELQMGYMPKEWLSLLGGFVYEYAHSDPYVFKFSDDGSTHPFSPYFDSKTNSDFSFFGQALVTASTWADVILGFRYNINSDSGSSLLPRIGAVFKVSDSTYLKALYAEAYRSPDFFEKNVSTYNVLYGDTSLNPEKVRSYDIAIDSTFKQTINLRVNAFFLETRDLVTRSPTTDPDFTGPNAAQYINSGGENIWGAEAGLAATIGNMMTINGSYAYTEGESRDTGDELEFVPRHIAAAFVKIRLVKWLSVTPQAQYISDRGEADAYSLYHMTIDCTLNDNLHLAITGQNLTDEDYAYPEYIRNVIETIPAGPGRCVFIRLRWRS